MACSHSASGAARSNGFVHLPFTYNRTTLSNLVLSNNILWRSGEGRSASITTRCTSCLTGSGSLTVFSDAPGYMYRR